MILSIVTNVTFRFIVYNIGVDKMLFEKEFVMLKGYRTIIFFGLLLVIAVANFFGFADFQMPAELQSWYTVLVPLFGLILRKLTKTEVFKKE